jgi:DNA helicase-2/ATP-dependent DNA helicase PcrA
MKNKILIAAAGAGKTTLLINEALKIKDEKILITTFTEANKDEIVKKFYEINKFIPGNITIMTWFSFLILHGAKPFQLKDAVFDIEGLNLVNQQSAIKFYNNKIKHYVYWKEDEICKYYFDKNHNIYSDKLAKFVIKCNEANNGYVIKRLNKIFQYIFIDEVQDLSGYDLEIIKLFFESNINILLVGDPRQTTYTTHYEKKYQKYCGGKIIDFINNECIKDICEIDKCSLNVSYRCNQEIIDLASKLFPEFLTPISGNKILTGHDGVKYINADEVEEYYNIYRPTILTYNKKSKVTINHEFSKYNFGISKGLTFDRILIYPTKAQLLWLKGRNIELNMLTKCKLYVALTRAKFSIAIVEN